MRKKWLAATFLSLLWLLTQGAGCSDNTSGPGTDGPAASDLQLPDAGTGADLPAPLEASVPDQVLADAALPDSPAVDTALPDAALPDAALPDTALPDVPGPDTMPAPDAFAALSVVVTYPPRAAMLTGAAGITVTGQVIGPLSSLDKLTVNGTPVVPDASGSFSYPMTSAWGLNIVTVECLDKAGRLTNIAQSYHYSTKYWGMQPGAPATMAVSQGALARLYQKAIDDGNRQTLNDLATILEKVINAADLDGQIPSTLASGTVLFISYKVVKNGTLTYNPISLTLKARSGGLHLTASSSSMSLPVKMTAPLSKSGTVKISNLSIVGDINISKASGGTLQVSVPSLSVTYSSLTVDLGSGIANAILSAIVNGITSLFKSTITSSFASEIKKALPGPIKSFVGGFKFTQSFNLPAELGSKTLSIYSALDQIAFDSGGGTLRLDAAVYATQGIPSGKLGSISIAGTYSPPSTSASAMQVGLRYDCLNQVLCAAWFSGALQQDLSQVVLAGLGTGKLPFTISGLTLTIDPLLPPILMPGTQGYDFDVGAGDILVKLDLQLSGSGSGTIHAELYASAVVGGNISLSTANEIVIQLASTPQVLELEVAKLTFQGSGFPSPGLLSQGLKELVNQVLPQLAPSIIQQFPIPGIDLSALGGSYGIPANTVLKLTGATLSKSGYHLVLTGDLS